MKQNHSREFDQKREPALHYPKEAKNIVDQIRDNLQKAGEDLSQGFQSNFSRAINGVLVGSAMVGLVLQGCEKKIEEAKSDSPPDPTTPGLVVKPPTGAAPDQGAASPESLIRIHTGKTMNTESVSLSGDGRFAVFAAAPQSNDGSVDLNSKGIYLYDAKSGEIERISSPEVGGAEPTISEDGRFVAFTGKQKAKVPPAAIPNQNNQGIYVFDREMKTLESVTLDFKGNSRTPIISGDGRTILFLSTVGSSEELFAYSTSAKSSKLISNPPGDNRDIEIHSISQDGKTAVFKATGSGMPRGTEPEPEAPAPARFLAPTPSNTSPYSHQVIVADLMAGTFGRPPIELHEKLGSRLNFADAPVLSRDGTKILFQVSGEHYLHDLSGSKTEPLPEIKGRAAIPNKDASVIAINDDGRIFLWQRNKGLKRLDDLNVKLEETQHKAKAPAISADGSTVAFVTSGRLEPGDTNFSPDLYLYRGDAIAPTRQRECPAWLAEALAARGGARTYENFQSIASEKINHPDALQDTIRRNEYITAAYAELYRDHNYLKWAGLAAFASEAVGEGADWTSWGLFGVPGELTKKETIQLKEILMNGNVELFKDIYWQHLAFLCGGVEILQKYKDVTVHPTQLEAWKALEKGIESGNQEDIWRSATLIADFEQNEFLQQKVYDPSMELWKEITGYAEGLSVWGNELGLFQDFAGRFFIGSPVPGDNNHFVKVVGKGANIGSKEQRWDWIEKSVLPAWREKDGSGVVKRDIGRFILKAQNRNFDGEYDASFVPRTSPHTIVTAAGFSSFDGM